MLPQICYFRQKAHYLLLSYTHNPPSLTCMALRFPTRTMKPDNSINNSQLAKFFGHSFGRVRLVDNGIIRYKEIRHHDIQTSSSSPGLPLENKILWQWKAWSNLSHD